MKFESKREIVLALLDKKRFYDNENDVTIYYDESKPRCPFRANDIAMTYSWELDIEWVELKEWYQEIPEQGTLCWVWNSIKQVKHMSLVKDWEKDYEFPFITENDDWVNATPVLREELEGLIYE